MHMKRPPSSLPHFEYVSNCKNKNMPTNTLSFAKLNQFSSKRLHVQKGERPNADANGGGGLDTSAPVHGPLRENCLVNMEKCSKRCTSAMFLQKN